MKGDHIYLRAFRPADAQAKLKLEKDNREFFEKFSMTRYPDFYTLMVQKEIIEIGNEQREEGREESFGIYKNEDDTLVGMITLFQIFRGPLQRAFLGYALDKNHNNKGYATEAVKLIVDYAFQKLQLHRIEAGVMPHNIPSMRVLEKAGFHKEGIAKSNVKINGKWEDHQVLAIINPKDDRNFF
ncbi:ribosomal-protein-alanine N-acetyltransferase [Planomicrobium soli]|uniref:Ribosomal-protein-alanine N-acetyltransferase n=1 Tax=Planomicrobium soli TaxID=1176648 RepID=A0A2P8H1Q6_9BACL|nr:GNAT family protein [Planomicrobium soli]PSL40145.1 ribosomal-protein-alanine N-acetyltransferase [Planomicrobium soli]